MYTLILLYKQFSCASVGNKKDLDNSRMQGTNVKKGNSFTDRVE